MSDSKQDVKTVNRRKKRATNLLKEVGKTSHISQAPLVKEDAFVEGVWILALYIDGTELKIPIPQADKNWWRPKEYKVPIERSAEVKLISLTNGVKTVSAMKGPLYCGHKGCARKNCSGTLRGITSELIRLVRAAK